ncbi:molybdopterin-dependent oxidoreductase [Caenimonas soli]|uniref:molybdopterin-dependent oxidoreductase n=1 Tax=Caenimonas soli TaxID=2735555 RepID=UPI00155313DD|nr:molybdopterin-dependent oxidoreductase [Caenimonas soli]NPC56910.1 molybdopterin-dependent oxidoreductase [Caenimonas soli]
MEQKPGYCTLCRSRCGTINTVQGDSLVAVTPNPLHPTGQSMCMKGRAAPELVHSPHRLFHPMRRTRPKTDPDPGWQRISWEEALAEIADRLATIRRESGPEAVAFAVTTPSGTPLSDSIEWIERFVRLFGSPNICYGTEVCNWHKDFAHEFTFGCGMPTADYANTDLVLLWGHNPTNTWLAQANAIERGRAAGARLMVVDPRPTSLATQADSWLAVRPGTDAALALGLMRLLIRSERFDIAFVREWTNAPFLVRTDTGRFLRMRDIAPDCAEDAYVVWDRKLSAPAAYDTAKEATSQGAGEFALRGDFLVPIPASEAGAGQIACTPAFELLARQCEPFAPGCVADITGIPAEQLVAAADLLARSANVAYHAWTGVGQHTNATQTERAIATLYALLGCFDRAGGNRLFGKPPHRVINALDLLDPHQRSKALGLEQRPLGPPAQGWVTARDTYRAILEGKPYRVRAMMAFGTNLPVAQADTALAQAALAALEFCVQCDLFETPSARYADILLPINTPWEREGLRVGFEIDAKAAAHVQLRQRMVLPRGESRSDTDVLFDLAPRLGLGKEFFGGSLEAGWNHMLEPLGLSVAQLREHPEGMAARIDAEERKYTRRTEEGGVLGFATETRRVELYSERLLRHGYSPLPAHIEPAESPLDPARTRHGRFPYVLSSAKNGYYCHSQHRSLPSLRRRAPYPVAEIAESLAAEKGIAEGDWVRISTRIGQARFVARLLRSLAHGLIIAEHGWWQACPEIGQPGYPTSGRASSNFNTLISAEDCDPISGSVAHRSFLCDIERDPNVSERQRGWAGWRRFRVAALEPKAEGVLGIQFEAEDGRLLPDHLPGQHLQIRVNTSNGAETLTRAYSLTGAAEVEDRRAYTIAVRRQAGRTADGSAFEGKVSGFLHHALKVGDLVELTKPSGSFVLPRDCAQPVVMIAGGIGITPFMSLLETLLQQRETPELMLYYANQNGRLHAFRQRITELAGRLPRLRVVNHYSAPLPQDRLGLDYDSAELIAADAIDRLLIERRARFYLCGPQPMMDALRAGLMQRGVPAFDIFSEAFRSPAAMPADGLKQCKVTFSKSGGSEAHWTPAHGTLLQLGESLGVAMPSGCRVGQCESCAVRIVSGRVTHLSGAEPEDPAMCLACQAVPLGDIVLDA